MKVEENSVLKRVEQAIHFSGITKWRNFLQKSEIFNIFHKNKKRHSCHFLAQNWGNVVADYEGNGRIYDLPGMKLAPIDEELFTGNVFYL